MSFSNPTKGLSGYSGKSLRQSLICSHLDSVLVPSWRDVLKTQTASVQEIQTPMR
jgi:hypothetical protein